MIRAMMATAGAMALAACGGGMGGNGPGSGAVAAGCRANSNVPDEICACVDERAVERLSPGGYAFLAATLNEDREAIERLRSELPFDEIAQAGLFPVSAFRQCAMGQLG